MTQPMRISNAADGSWIECRYSTIDPFSKNNTYLLLIHQHHFELYDGSGKWLKRLALSADSEPCWSRTDNHILYYRWNNEVREFDVRTEVSVTLRKFPAPISGRGESDLSADGEHLVLADDANRIWIYNVRTDQLRVGEIWQEPFNALYILSSNDVLVCTYTGVYLLSDGRKIASTLAHNAGASYQGRDIFIWGSSADAKINANALWAIDVKTGAMRMLLNLEWAYAYHVAACARDWCIVSTYAPSNTFPSQILKVRLDGSGSEVLCATGSVMMKDPSGGMAYNPTPRASVSRDGSRVVFNSNSGVLDRGPNYVDVFMLIIDLPYLPPDPPTPQPPIVVTPSPDLHMELDALRKDNAILRERLAAHMSLERQLGACQNELHLARNVIIRAQEDARVATAQVMGLRLEMDALERLLADPAPDPDIWELLDLLKLGHLPEQRWDFQLQDNGKYRMRDVIADDDLRPIAIPKGNQFLFVETGDGIEQYQRKTNTK